jgi:hypothetical protein
MDDSKNDPFAPMEEMMKGVPGGDYFLMMMRNNPEARDALTSIDPSDPESMFTALRRVLGAFGIGGPQADLLLGQARQMMNDPESMQRMSASRSRSPSDGSLTGMNSRSVIGPPFATRSRLPRCSRTAHCH